MPKVSVIIPCYNAAALIGETIESVQSQTFQDWEIIVVDDGSVDSSAQVVQDYSAKDSRITYVYIENQGVSHARNYGIKKATAAYIAFLDSDDLWYPNRLEKMLAYMDVHPDCGVLYSRLDFLDEAGRKTGQVSTPLPIPLDPVELLIENRVCTSSNILTRKEVVTDIGNFAEDMSFAEDQEWLFRVAYHPHWKVDGILDLLMGYRASDGGLSASLEKMYVGWEAMVDKIYSYAPELVSKHKKHAQAIYYRYLARRALRLRHEKEVGWQYYKKAVGSDIAVLWTEPKRSLPTLVAVLLRATLPDKLGASLLEKLKIIPKQKQGGRL